MTPKLKQRLRIMNLMNIRERNNNLPALLFTFAFVLMVLLHQLGIIVFVR